MRQEREGKGSQGKEGEEKGGEKDYSDDGAGALRARALLSLSCFRVHVSCLHFPCPLTPPLQLLAFDDSLVCLPLCERGARQGEGTADVGNKRRGLSA